jgi:hypothetical protein
MRRIEFVVEQQPEGRYVAHSIGACIVTEAGSLQELRVQVREAVRCHCDECDQPESVLLKFMRLEQEETLEL